ncbi:MAG: RusA family crossover junction endodeoxyribonuclease [Actinomycetota bacterium]|nr:RusA family crossover junction endodeoxyribonuclease [Actinomycetota bacterium]
MITIRVAGVPAPQGSKRHVGGGRMIESSRAVAPWREAVRAETQRVMGPARARFGDEYVSRFAYCLRDPVQVTVKFTLPRPQGHYGTGRNATRVRPSAPRWPHRKPDLDKLIRAVLDGITQGGAIADDAQVVRIAAQKTYGTPGAVITIEELT